MFLNAFLLLIRKVQFLSSALYVSLNVGKTARKRRVEGEGSKTYGNNGSIIPRIVARLVIHGSIVDIMHIHYDLLYVLVPST